MSKENKWTAGPIEGVEINKLHQHRDRRGFLCETFRLDELPPGLQPVMSYVSFTGPGIARGPHEHREQTDIFALIGPGNFQLKLWDNRQGSKTYGNCLVINAGRDNPLNVVVPPGVVHGYRNISKQESGMVINYPDRLYRGAGKKEAVDEIRHEADPSSPFTMEVPER